MKDIPIEVFGTKAGTTDPKQRWWLEDPRIQYQSIVPLVKQIEQNQAYMSRLHYKYAKLVNNIDLLGYNSLSSPTNSNQRNSSDRPTYNVVKSVVDTITSGIAKSKPRPQFLTDEGDYKLQQRAKKLSKYVEGVLYETDAYTVGQTCFVDSCVFGTGVIKIFEQNNQIKLERVFPDELIVDYYDGMYGTPRQIHQVKFIDRAVLVESFPDHKNAILAAPNGLSASAQASSTVDMVKVVESWHLPSGKEAGDGVRSICIDTATLTSEPYTKQYFPFVFLRYSDRLAGFYGQGVVEQIVGVQIEINKTLKNIQRAQHLVAVPRVLVDTSGPLPTSQISNEIGSLIKYTGTKPDFFTPTGMNPEVYRHLQWLISSAFEMVGVSQLRAGSKKPAGLDSGVALREYSDIESERFAIVGQKYESFFLEISEIIVDMSRDLYLNNKDLKVNIKGRDFIKSIKWSEVDLADDAFVMQLFPTNMLPKTPAGRLQAIQELVQSGFIDKDVALDLLDFPDLQSAMNLGTANISLIKKQLDDIMEDGTYNPPEPAMDLVRALTMAQNTYLELRAKNGTDEALELILRYIDDCNRLIQLSTPTELALPTEPVSNVAVPEAAPTSDLLPIQPEG